MNARTNIHLDKHNISQTNLQSHTCRLIAQTRQTRSKARLHNLSKNGDPHSLVATILEASHALYNLNTCTIYSSTVAYTRVTVEIHLPEVLSLPDLVLAIFLSRHPSLEYVVWHFCRTRELEGQRRSPLNIREEGNFKRWWTIRMRL